MIPGQGAQFMLERNQSLNRTGTVNEPVPQKNMIPSLGAQFMLERNRSLNRTGTVNEPIPQNEMNSKKFY